VLPKRSRIILCLVVLLLGLALALLYLPLDVLEGLPRQPALEAEAAQRTAALFATIEGAKGLELPFPAMVERAENPSTAKKIELGRLLYFDPILSSDNTLSCAHCHHPDLGFADGRGRSMGRAGHGVGTERQDGDVLRRGAPTVWNAAYAPFQFWDGRARDLEEQAAGPIRDAHEMASSVTELEAELRGNAEYVSLFDHAFGGQDGSGISFEHVTFAVAAFERTLISRNSPFDRYAAGDHQALSAAARRGLDHFRSLRTRCFECHGLPTFANGDFKVIGVPDTRPPGPDAPDRGRGEQVAELGKEFAFKVPTLRNVALTAPYMHNGRFETLEEVIHFYSKGGGLGFRMILPNLDDKMHQFELSDDEQADLIAFLEALTDESAMPEVPEKVPSGLPVVARLPRPAALAAAQPAPEPARSPIRRQGNELWVGPGERIQDAIDASRPGDTIWVEPGVYHETLTLDVKELRLLGKVEGEERPILDGRNELSDGMIGAATDLEVSGFAMRDYTANGIMIHQGKRIVLRDLRAQNTGLYGVYPVQVIGLLVEDCEVEGASDAGIYVGQSKDIVVRGNRVHGNVSGIEIENSLDALVEKNEVWNNSVGIIATGLPDIPSKESKRARLIGNRIYENNHANFAHATANVGRMPPGIGILLVGTDEAEVRGNELRGNKGYGVVVWNLNTLLEGRRSFDLDPFPDDNVIAGNTYQDNGLDPGPEILARGLTGGALYWDLTGKGNVWDEPGIASQPRILPGADSSPLARRAGQRFFRLWRYLTGQRSVGQPLSLTGP